MLNPNHVFENYVSTTSNRCARAACLTFARSTHPPYNPLYLYGPTSTGKTHLLHAIANLVKSQRPLETVILVTAEELLNEMYGALGAHMTRFRERYTSADLLLVDDIHVLAGKEKTQKEFLRIFEALIANGGHLAMTSSKKLVEMPVFSEAMGFRMKRFFLLPIKSPSRLEIEMILSRRFYAAVPSVPRNLIRMAAECGKGSDIRRAEGMVKQMVFADSVV